MNQSNQIIMYLIYNYYEPMGWNFNIAFGKKFGKNKLIPPNYHILEIFKNTKVLVCTYPQTTFSESLISNIPTILIFDRSLWPIKDEFHFLIDLLIEAKIIFQNPLEAADHINYYWNDIDRWWNNDKTIKVRNIAKEFTCNISTNCYQEWISFLKKID